jgi:hypothetical protein
MKRLMMYRVLVFFVLAFVSAQAISIEIEWEVVNRFRLFNEEDFLTVERAWNDSKPNNTARGFYTGKFLSNPEKFIPFDRTQYHRAIGKYADDYIEVHDKSTKIRLKTIGIENKDIKFCTWTVTYEKKIILSKRIATCSDELLVSSIPYEKPILVTLEGNNIPTITKGFVVHDELIVALGDSYASGEGNSDRPAKYSDKHFYNYGSWFYQSKIDGDFRKEILDKPSQWWDQQCHRSLLSWQVMAALRLAIEDKHRSITLLSFACSGAEIVNGLFQAQEDPPAYIGGKDNPVALSQIEAVWRTLCVGQQYLTKNIVVVGENKVPVTSCYKSRRQINALLLSIGGNDVLFGPVVTGILLPSFANHHFYIDWPVRQLALTFLTRPKAKVKTASSGIDAVDQLHPHYSSFIENLTSSLLVSKDKTLIMRYPDPTPNHYKVKSSEIEGFKNRNLALSQYLDSQEIFGIHYLYGWTAEFDQEEFKEIKEFVSSLSEMQSSLEKNGFNHLIKWDSSSESFSEHNIFMARETHEMEPYFFCDKVKGTFECVNENPYKWNAFSRSSRWIHLANDSAIALRSWSTYSSEVKEKEELKGMFHPTIEAHAVAADSAYADLKLILGR